MMMNRITDAHIHLANTDSEHRDYIDSCSMMFSCSARPDEWRTQIDIAEKDDSVIPFYGTHPWYCSEHDNRLLEEILNEHPDSCIGEIGLDYLKDHKELQKMTFELQLELAEHYERPITIHMVRSEMDVLNALRVYKLKGIILHSFDSASYVKPFTELDCFFSISPRILRKGDKRIDMLLNSIPEDRLLIESDYPDCNGSMTDLIAKMSSVLSIDEDELLNITGTNARNVLQ